MQSLVTRVLVAAGVVLVVFLGLAAFALDVAFRNAALAAVNERLQIQAFSLISAADVDDDGILAMPPQLPEARLRTPGSGLYAQVLDRNGETVWRSTSAVGVAMRAPERIEPGVQEFRRVRTLDGEQLFQFGLTVLWDDGDEVVGPQVFHFMVGEIVAPYRAQLARYRRGLFGWFGLVFAALIASQLVVLRRTLRPLRTLAGEVADVESGGREAVGDLYPRELQRLARNLNAVIRNERGHLARYRNTLGDLAHSLKTPLAVVKVALDEPPTPARDATIAEQVERMNEIVRFQLQRALAANGETFGRAVPVRPEVDALVASLAKVYAERRLVFEVAVDPAAVFRGDRSALLEVLGNVLDNACKWARSRVQVTAANDGDALGVTVIDDGPGIPGDARDAVLGRGIRADERGGGQGIGLAVVADIAAARGGGVTLHESRLGGLEVRLRL